MCYRSCESQPSCLCCGPQAGKSVGWQCAQAWLGRFMGFIPANGGAGGSTIVLGVGMCLIHPIKSPDHSCALGCPEICGPNGSMPPNLPPSRVFAERMPRLERLYWGGSLYSSHQQIYNLGGILRLGKHAPRAWPCEERGRTTFVAPVLRTSKLPWAGWSTTKSEHS